MTAKVEQSERLRARVLGACLAIACLAAPVLAPSSASADVRTDARQHFRRGMALIAEGNLDEGVAELEVAFDILPHPNVLYNIARAYAEGGRYEEALDYFQRYLDSDPADRDEVTAFISALEARIQAREDAARVAATPPPETTTTETTTETTAEVPFASEEEIQALQDSATQIAALAEATQSEALRQRAERLRLLAEALEARRTASTETSGGGGESGTGGGETTGGTGTGAGTGGGGAETGTGATPEGALSLGESRQGETYEESVVSSSRAAESPLDAPNSTAVITAQDLRLSALPGQSWVHSLRRVAGVSFAHTDPGNPQLNVRGLNQRLSNRTVVLVDGRTVYLDFLGTTLYELLPLAPEDIERVEIIRGPASALYGADAFSGIVNIITRPLGEGRSYVSAQAGDGGFLRVQSGVYGRADRFRFRVTGGYTRYSQYALEVDSRRVDVTPFQSDPNLGYSRLAFSGDLSYRFDGGYSVRAGGGVGVGEITFQGVSRLRQLAGTSATFSQVYGQFETPFGLSARVFWNRFGVLPGNTAQIPGGLELAQSHEVSRSDVIDSEVVFNTTFDIGGIENQLIAGVAYRFKEVVWDWLQGGAATQHHGGVFIQDTLHFSDVLQAVVSVRGDLHPLAGPQVSPRGSVVIHPTEGQSIRLTGGAAFRSPTFVESYVQVPNATPVRSVTAFGIGNTSLNPERIVSIELGYMNQMTEYFALELNGYYNLVFDQILLTRSSAFRLQDFGGGNPLARYYPEHQAYPLSTLQFENQPEQFQQLGGELGIRVYPVSGLDIYANYAIHETSPFGGPQGALHTDARTSAHMINAGVQWRSEFGLDLGIDFSWQSEQFWTEQVLDAERGGTAFVRFYLPAYATLNARIGWRFFDDQLELAVSGTNLIEDGHREHPFGQPVPRRFFGSATVRF